MTESGSHAGGRFREVVFGRSFSGGCFTGNEVCGPRGTSGESEGYDYTTRRPGRVSERSPRSLDSNRRLGVSVAVSPETRCGREVFPFRDSFRNSRPGIPPETRCLRTSEAVVTVPPETRCVHRSVPLHTTEPPALLVPGAIPPETRCPPAVVDGSLSVGREGSTEHGCVPGGRVSGRRVLVQ